MWKEQERMLKSEKQKQQSSKGKGDLDVKSEIKNLV